MDPRLPPSSWPGKTLEKQVSDLNPNLLNQKLWRWGPAICFIQPFRWFTLKHNKCSAITMVIITMIMLLWYFGSQVLFAEIERNQTKLDQCQKFSQQYSTIVKVTLLYIKTNINDLQLRKISIITVGFVPGQISRALLLEAGLILQLKWMYTSHGPTFGVAQRGTRHQLQFKESPFGWPTDPFNLPCQKQNVWVFLSNILLTVLPISWNSVTVFLLSKTKILTVILNSALCLKTLYSVCEQVGSVCPVSVFHYHSPTTPISLVHILARNLS